MSTSKQLTCVKAFLYDSCVDDVATAQEAYEMFIDRCHFDCYRHLTTRDSHHFTSGSGKLNDTPYPGYCSGLIVTKFGKRIPGRSGLEGLVTERLSGQGRRRIAVVVPTVVIGRVNHVTVGSERHDATAHPLNAVNRQLARPKDAQS